VWVEPRVEKAKEGARWKSSVRERPSPDDKGGPLTVGGIGTAPLLIAHGRTPSGCVIARKVQTRLHPSAHQADEGRSCPWKNFRDPPPF
jgi:hypothetical protein